MPNATASDAVPGRTGAAGERPRTTTPVGVDRISVGELIARTVERRVAALERRIVAAAGAPSRRTDIDDADALTLPGHAPALAPHEAIRLVRDTDVALEIERALSAFAAGRYRVIVDGRDRFALDEEVSLCKAASARFPRGTVPIGG